MEDKFHVILESKERFVRVAVNPDFTMMEFTQEEAEVFIRNSVENNESIKGYIIKIVAQSSVAFEYQ